MINLIRHHPDVAVLFLPISIRFDTNDAMTALRCLAGRLSLFFPSERIGHDSNLSAEDYKTIIHSLLNTLSYYPERHFVLVIDGADEAVPGWFDATLFPYEPPANLKVLLSARYKPGHSDGKAWLDDLSWECAETSQVLLDLPPLDRAGLSDVLACLGRPLDRLVQRETILEELYRLSEEGDPLLVSLYTERLWERRDQLDTLMVEEIRQLQPGFKGFFEKWHRDQEKLWQQEGRQYQRRDLENLFTLLATALAPLKFADLHAVAERAGLQRLDELSDMLAAASRLIIGDGETQGYTFSHPKLGYYFLDQLVEEGLWSKQQALRVVKQLGDDNKSAALAGLVNLLRDSSALLRQALYLARQITREDIRAKTLLALAPQLTGEERCTVLQEALAAARQVPDEARRAEALVALAPQLAGEERCTVLRESLVAVQQITFASDCAKALVALAPRLAGELALLQEALVAARQIAYGPYRVEVLGALALNADVSYDLWVNLAEILLTLKRPNLLEVIPSLLPHIEQLGGQQAIK